MRSILYPSTRSFSAKPTSERIGVEIKRLPALAGLLNSVVHAAIGSSDLASDKGGAE